jgi:hypothetical protein
MGRQKRHCLKCINHVRQSLVQAITLPTFTAGPHIAVYNKRRKSDTSQILCPFVDAAIIICGAVGAYPLSAVQQNDDRHTLGTAT